MKILKSAPFLLFSAVFAAGLSLPAAADDAETEEHTETAITLPEKPLTVGWITGSR